MSKSDTPDATLGLGTGTSRLEKLQGPHAQDDRLKETLYSAREDERRRVARELHDDLGQRVALLSIEAAEAVQSIPSGFTTLARKCRSIQSQALVLARDIRRVA